MSRPLAAYLLIAVLCQPLVAGWLFADMQAHPYTLLCRREAGYANTFGLMTLAAWPVVVPLAYLLTGFAEHGWRAPYPSSCRTGEP